MIKAVIFDIDNTMYNFDRAHRTAMDALLDCGKKELGLEPELLGGLIKETQQKIISRLGMNDSAIHNRLIRFQCVLETLKDRDLTKALGMYHAYWDTILDVMKPEPGLTELISALHTAGISVGVGSDMTAYIQFQKLARLNVLKDMSFIVTSEEAGAEKPSAEFFRLCVEKAGCLPGECVFIGDSLKKDVEGAEAFGLHGIWYCPGENSPEGNGRIEAGRRITSFRDCLRESRILLGDYEVKRCLRD